MEAPCAQLGFRKTLKVNFFSSSPALSCTVPVGQGNREERIQARNFILRLCPWSLDFWHGHRPATAANLTISNSFQTWFRWLG